MPYGSDHRSRVRSIAVCALRSLRRHGLAPTAENYHLFYAYHQGSHPALTRELDERLQSGAPLDSATCRALYERYLGVIDYEKTIERARRQLIAIGERLGDEVGAASAGIHNPSERVEQLAAQAARTTDVVELRELVAQAVAEARAVWTLAVQLERQLRLAQAELTAIAEDFLSAKRQAETDPLTGLPNRRRFERALADALLQVERGQPPPVLLLADVDHFKSFNDRYGHALGDLVLCAVAQLLARNVRREDLVCRWGGEEFAVLMQPCGLAQGLQLAERLRQIVGSRRIRHRTTGRDLGTVTLSIGIGEAAPTDTAAAWIDRVDQALYRAKRAGRNRVMIAEAPTAAHPPAEPAVSARPDGGPATAICVLPLPAAEAPL